MDPTGPKIYGEKVPSNRIGCLSNGFRTTEMIFETPYREVDFEYDPVSLLVLD